MKKLFSILLTVILILPLSVFSVSADSSDWNFLAAKYSTKTKIIIAPKNNDYKIKDDYFIFDECGSGEIKVTTPGYDPFAGAFGISAIASKKTLPLDDLSIVIDPNDFDFTQDKHGRSNQISFIWSDKPVTEIAGGLSNGIFSTGIYNSAQLANGGLRNLLSPDSKGLCVTVSNNAPGNIGTKTATTVRIVYYDGSYTDENGNLGYCWVFTRNPAEGISPLSEPSVRTTPYEDIDLTFGLVIDINPDTELGYVVNINGKNYYGEYAGYSNNNMKDIDLSDLKNISEGYVTVGAVSNDDQTMTDHRCNYTLSYINDKRPAALWNDLPVPHEHSYTESRTEPTCTKEGKVLYICECGVSYGEVLHKTAHTEGKKIETTPGNVDVYCLVCGEYMYTKNVFIPHVHFDDVKKSHWYYDGICHVVSKGYMYGMNEHIFSPNTDLTREQFVTILAKMARVDTDQYKNDNLMTDVPPGRWYSGAVNWAVNEGYVAGIAEGVFGVGRPIQRAALARLLYLYAERNGKETEEKADLSVYTDFDKVQEWMADGLGWAVKYGIITSTKDNELVLDPTATATRAQCARMLMIYDKVPLEIPDPEPTPIPPEPDPEEPESDPDPLGVDKDKLRDFIISSGKKTSDGTYSLNYQSLTLIYDKVDELLYTEYADTMMLGFDPHYFSYVFGSDEVNIHGAGNIMPLIEHGGDLSLIKPYLKVIATAQMTTDGIINAPAKYRSELDRMYRDIIDMLKVLDVLK